jgi:hypothetical protein
MIMSKQNDGHSNSSSEDDAEYDHSYGVMKDDNHSHEIRGFNFVLRYHDTTVQNMNRLDREIQMWKSAQLDRR